jgi:[acyl-carrier-protein] S-malonyltransferase
VTEIHVTVPGDGERTFLLFPGQGSQSVGMCQRLDKNYAAARTVLDEASEALGLDIRHLMWHTTPDVLKQTENAQPAIVIASVAAFRVWCDTQAAPPVIAWGAGHSIGALAAAIACGYLTVADGAVLARRRGQLMASVKARGGMLAVAVTSDEARDLCLGVAERLGLDVAAVNGTQQIVLSGAAETVAQAKEALGGRSRLLEVSNAFHSRLMEPVLPEWGEVLDSTPWVESGVPYLGSASGALVASAADVAADLRHGLRNPVRWDLVLQQAAREHSGAVLGPGRSLAKLWRSRPQSVALELVDDDYRKGGPTR